MQKVVSSQPLKNFPQPDGIKSKAGYLKEPQQNIRLKSESFSVARSASLHPTGAQDSQQINTRQAFVEHKLFLNQYKQNREHFNQRKNSYKLASSTDESSTNAQRRCHSMANKITELSDPVTKDALSNKFAEIQKKVMDDLTRSESPGRKSPYKLFTENVQSKKDVERITRQRRFMRSQADSHYDYEEPNMPIQVKLPIKFRIKTEAIYDQAELGKQALQFASRIQQEQEKLLGEHMLRKKRQDDKKKEFELELKRKSEDEFKMKKAERRVKAENAIALIKQKSRIAAIFNKMPEDEWTQISKIREESKQKINQAKTQTRQSMDGNRHSTYSRGLLYPKHPKEQKFKQLSRKYGKLKKLVTQTDNSQFGQGQRSRLKSRIAIKRGRKLYPTDYHQSRGHSCEQSEQARQGNYLTNRTDQEQGLGQKHYSQIEKLPDSHSIEIQAGAGSS